MIYLRKFNVHSEYETVKSNLKLPNVSYDIEHVHFNPYVEPQQPDNEIWYTSIDGNIVETFSSSQPTAVSNVVDGDHCVITFENDLTTINGLFYMAGSSNPNINVTSISFPSSLTTIGWQCVRGTSITELVIPGTVKTIGYDAFNLNSELLKVEVQEGVEDMSAYGIFSDCPKLNTVILPKSTTKIGDSMFSGCNSLTQINYNGNINDWNAINKDNYWTYGSLVAKIVCLDGEITL